MSSALCLNDKLSQIDASHPFRARPRAEPARRSERNDNDRARHEFTVIKFCAIASEPWSRKPTSASARTGFVGESEITSRHRPDHPRRSSDFPDEPIVSQPPVISSPTS
jgi:hypothetical protein